MVKLQRRIYTANQALQLFMLTSWTFENDQFLLLHKDILPGDIKDFRFNNFVTADVREYLQNCVLGARRYLLKEPDENLPKARKNYLRLWYIDAGTKILVYALVVYIILAKMAIV